MYCPQCGVEYRPEYAWCNECGVKLVPCLPDNSPATSLADEFVQIARFNTRLEAEAVGHALDQYDIPFLVKSDDIGIFGPGHVMATPQGASLWVPISRRAEVADLLSCVFFEDEQVTRD